MTMAEGVYEHGGDVKVLEVEPTVTVQEYDIHENGTISGGSGSPVLSHCTSYTIVADDLQTGLSSYDVTEPEPEPEPSVSATPSVSASSSPNIRSIAGKNDSRDTFIRTFKTLVDIVDEPMQDDIHSLLTSEDDGGDASDKDDEDDDDNDGESNPLIAIYSKSKTMLEALTIKSRDAMSTSHESAESWSLKGLVKWL